MIEALGLTMRFGRRTVVDRLSFGVGRGELCALLGRNGAGKSTTMRLLTGVLRAAEGRARIDGHDVIAERRAAAASIGFLPEAAAGFSRLTVGEFLRFCGESRGLAGRRLGEAVDRVIEHVHAHEARDAPMGELSKGWRQRAWLAQALLHDPPVLILDEPTDGLDPHRAPPRPRAARGGGAAQGGAALDPRPRRSGGDRHPRHPHRPGPHRRRRRSRRPRRRTGPARPRVPPAGGRRGRGRA